MKTGLPIAKSSAVVRKNGRDQSHEKPSRTSVRSARHVREPPDGAVWKRVLVAVIAAVEHMNDAASAANGSACAMANSTPPRDGPTIPAAYRRASFCATASCSWSVSTT